MLVNDARGNPVTASGPLPVALLDDAVEAYLGFRKDTGDRLKAALTAEPGIRRTWARRRAGIAGRGVIAAPSLLRGRTRRLPRCGAAGGADRGGWCRGVAGGAGGW